MAWLQPDQPMWLPAGSIRACLALGFGITTCAGFLKGRIETQAFLVIMSAIITFYFTKKQPDTNGDVHEVPGKPPQQG